MLLDFPRRVFPMGASGTKITVDLSSHAPLFGAIVMCQSGVIWRNQTAGVACHHPTAEGFFVPIASPTGGLPAPDPYYNVKNGIYTAKGVFAWLCQMQIDHIFEPLDSIGPILFEGEPMIEEAWVPVRVRKVPLNADAEPWKGFAGYPAIITYANSD